MKKIMINGKEYNSLDEVPFELRDLLKGLMPGQNPMSGDPVKSFVNSAFRRVSILFLFIALPFLLVGGILFYITRGDIIGGLFYQGTVKPPGDVNNFDPITTFSEVRSYAGENVRFVSMLASQVRSDGTMNLKAEYLPNPYLDYRFYLELSQKPKDAPPVGDGGTNGKWFQPVTVNIRNPGKWLYMKRIGGDYNFEGNYLHQGMEKDVSPALGVIYEKVAEPPVCPLKDLWKIAQTKGASADAVADIKYDANGYNFRINDLNIDLQFGVDCNLKLAG